MRLSPASGVGVVPVNLRRMFMIVVWSERGGATCRELVTGTSLQQAFHLVPRLRGQALPLTSTVYHGSRGIKCYVNRGIKCYVNRGIKCYVNRGIKCYVNRGIKCYVNRGIICYVNRGINVTSTVVSNVTSTVVSYVTSTVEQRFRLLLRMNHLRRRVFCFFARLLTCLCFPCCAFDVSLVSSPCC